MMPTKLITVALLLAAAAADPLATLEVCSAAKTVPACTVTAQHQIVSTCIPKSTSCDAKNTVKTCSTAYSYSSWAYVSTVIPCGWDGKTISSCTVTKTDEEIPCFASATTVTSVAPVKATKSWKEWSDDGSHSVAYETSYETISKQFAAPYNKLGSFAIPGYEGNELCKECAIGEDKSQYFDVTECKYVSGKEPSCQKYTETHLSEKSAPASSTPVTATNSLKTHVDKAGTYIFTFTNTAPATTITREGEARTIPAKPWFAYETKSCDGPKDFDFTVTKTKTVVVDFPLFTQSTGDKTSIDIKKAPGWSSWEPPVSVEAKTTRTESEAKPTSTTFVIPVDNGSKYSKGKHYVGFPDGDDATVVESKEKAAEFYFDTEGHLLSNGKYVYTSTGSGYLVFELTHEKPSGPKFNFGKGDSFTLPGAGFCEKDKTFFITFSGSPSGCKPVSCPLKGQRPNPTPTPSETKSETKTDWPTGWGMFSTLTTLTKSKVTSTWTKETATFTGAWTEEAAYTQPTMDPSADLDFPEPTEKPTMKKKGGILRKRV